MQKELIIERTLNAPRERVFKAWIDPVQVAAWWGPSGVTNPTCEIDPRPGGMIHIVMLAGKELGDLAGNEWPMTGVVKEIIEPEKFVFTTTAIMNDKPILETLNTITLEEYGDKTKMKLHILVTKETPEAAGPLSGMEMGWNQSLDKLTKKFS